MKILAILGSPRKNGNTSIVMREYLKGIRHSNDKVHIDEVFINGENISGCNGCNSCKTATPGECIIKDGMQKLYPKIKEADVLVFATPVYWWNMSAQIKTFIDRMYALNGKKDFAGKKVVLLMTYGGALPNEGPKIVEFTISEICKYLKMELAAVYGVCTEEGDVSQNSKFLSEAYNLGTMLKE